MKGRPPDGGMPPPAERRIPRLARLVQGGEDVVMPLHPLAVDRFAAALLEDIPPGDWAAMRDAVSDLVAAFRGAAERGDRVVHPGPDAREVVGDLIGKMEAPEVGSALQARLWSLSDRPSHRALGAAWLRTHPDDAAALEGQLDDHLRFVAEEPLTEDDATAPPDALRVTATFDGDAGLWTAAGPDGIAAEAPTKPDLLERLAAAVPDVLAGRRSPAGRATLIVDWREAGREHSTTLNLG